MTEYRFEFQVPAEASFTGKPLWLPFENDSSDPNRFKSLSEARDTYRRHRLGEHEWPVRLVSVTTEVIPDADWRGP